MPTDFPLTREEHAAILTGLRMLQAEIIAHGEPIDQFMDILTCAGELTPLTADELEDLCARVNGIE